MTAVLLPGASVDAAGNYLVGGRYVPRVLGASAATGMSCPADTTEDILATVTVPAGAMGLNGILRCQTLWTVTNSGNNKTLNIRLGGIGGTAFMNIVLTTSATFLGIKSIQNRGAANSQVGFTALSGSFGATTSATTTGAIDTSVATTLVITGQKASSGETLTLESYLVELLLP